ncbi:GNAT family N-acetyltransferase [uncultured Cedecea sp.]|uniref:GNAT family N-acetyltransferase n=1 Tax=uncultured Cedecea sp. TaxID=988762 RepID=UPI00261F6659|nr:GNAT family N-acetyltransferase [uncultured Cedecea sp.]
MQIRPLMDNPDYLAQTSDLLFREWSSLALWADEEKIQARLIARNASDSSQITLVAIDTENRVIATASLVHYELNDNPQRMHWLGEIITKPSHRGQGTGTLLINALIKHASEQKMTELWLYTPDMQPLYRKLGWEEKETRIVDGESVSLMVLNLDK